MPGDLPIQGDWPEGLPRDALASGSTVTPTFSGPGSVKSSVTLPLPAGWEPRTVVWTTTIDGEQLKAGRHVIEHPDGTLSGFNVSVDQRPDALTITVEVERTGPGAEPGHVIEFYVFSGRRG